jgi:radical SAM superfamily enzyme YgiQ (UPF0313 family)
MYLSSYLTQNGHDCELLDLKFQKNYIKEVKIINPDIIAYSITTNNWKRYYEVNLILKENCSFFSIFGGPHCTFFPEFIQNDGVDAICRGEGEYTILELVNALKLNRDITKIQNLWVKKNQEVFKNDLRPLIEDLDSLPFPDRELINKYNHYRKRSRVRAISSRGCPYNCSYCFNHANRKLYSGKGKYVRHRSPENIISEVKYLKNLYKPKNIEFHDDIFILDKNWLQKFVDLYLSEKINIPYEVNVRVDLVDEQVVNLLKKSGCYSAQFGIESGNEQIRKVLLKRNISNEMIIEVATLFNAQKIKTNTYNMLGYPNETVENVFQTLKLNALCKPTYAMNTIYYPYPMTELSEYASKIGLFEGIHEGKRKNLFYGEIVVDTPLKNILYRLHYLFAFGVKFPSILWLIKILIKIPLGYLYQLFYFLYRSYAVIFIFKRLSIKEILLNLIPDARRIK